MDTSMAVLHIATVSMKPSRLRKAFSTATSARSDI
jgi:hypothetical protein